MPRLRYADMPPALRRHAAIFAAFAAHATRHATLMLYAARYFRHDAISPSMSSFYDAAFSPFAAASLYAMIRDARRHV